MVMLRWYQELGAHRVLKLVTSTESIPAARTRGAEVVVVPGTRRESGVVGCTSTESFPAARTRGAEVVVGASELGAHWVLQVVNSGET